MAKYNIKIAVCDDLQTERYNILSMLHKYMDIHEYAFTIDEFVSGEDLLAADVNAYDLIILDIFMDKINGIDTAKELIKRENSAKIIFCSTSNEFAAESYEVDAIRYLTKPLSEEKLFFTLNRYFQTYTAMQMLTYKSNRIDEHILISDVIWIEASGHKCIIHTVNGDITTTTTLSQFYDQLKDADFIKPIRYALVPLRMISGVPTNKLKLFDGTEISIGRDLKQYVKDSYMDYKMKKLLMKGEI